MPEPQLTPRRAGGGQQYPLRIHHKPLILLVIRFMCIHPPHQFETMTTKSLPTNSVQEIEDEFWRVVEEVASSYGMTISPACEFLLRQHIQNVATTNFNAFASDPNTFLQAVEGLRTFVTRIADEAVQFGDDKFRETGFEEARRKCGIIFWCAK